VYWEPWQLPDTDWAPWVWFQAGVVLTIPMFRTVLGPLRLLFKKTYILIVLSPEFFVIAWSWLVISVQYQGYEHMELYLHEPYTIIMAKAFQWQAMKLDEQKLHETIGDIWDLMFSWQWRCQLWSSGMWCHDAMWSFIDGYQHSGNIDNNLQDHNWQSEIVLVEATRFF
jgi:hypothetical protein